jgi:hypothetical protein
MISSEVINSIKMDGFVRSPEVRRTWFDRLTMTVYKACPERVEGKDEAQHSIWASYEVVRR